MTVPTFAARRKAWSSPPEYRPITADKAYVGAVLVKR